MRIGIRAGSYTWREVHRLRRRSAGRRANRYWSPISRSSTRTITSGVYIEEIRKRCPRMRIVQQASANLAGAIEDEAPESELDALVAEAVAGIVAQTGGVQPHRAILGCTHFPLVEHLFRAHLAPSTRILSQPEVVAYSLEDYLERKPHYADCDVPGLVALLTTGDADEISARARVFWPDAPAFSSARS